MAQDSEDKSAYDKSHYQTHREKRRVQSKAYYHTHKAKVQEQVWELGQKAKLEALIHYSGNPPKCIFCGEEDIDVLCFDHINNDGAEHRKEQGLGRRLYYWLRKNKYPEGFQVLCCNCNQKKEIVHRRAKWRRLPILRLQ